MEFDLTESEKESGVHSIDELFPDVSALGTERVLIAAGYIEVHYSSSEGLSAPPSYNLSLMGKKYLLPSQKFRGCLSINGMIIPPVVKPGMLDDLRSNILLNEKAVTELERQREIFREEKSIQGSLLNSESQGAEGSCLPREESGCGKSISRGNVLRKSEYKVDSSETYRSENPTKIHLFIYWSMLPMLIALSMYVERVAGPSAATKVFGFGGLLWFVWPMWMAIGSNSMQRVKNSFRVMIYLIVFTVIILIVGSALSPFVGGSNVNYPADSYFRR